MERLLRVSPSRSNIPPVNEIEAPQSLTNVNVPFLSEDMNGVYSPLGRTHHCIEILSWGSQVNILEPEPTTPLSKESYLRSHSVGMNGTQIDRIPHHRKRFFRKFNVGVSPWHCCLEGAYSKSSPLVRRGRSANLLDRLPTSSLEASV